MKSLRTTALLVVAPAVALTVAAQGMAVAAPARHHPRHVVSVVGNGSHVRINHAVLHAGRVTFSVRSTNSAGESDITLFRPRPGHTLNEVFGDLAEEFSETPRTAAKGTRDLVQDVKTYGLADVSPARGALVTRSMSPGTYYLMDLGNPPRSGPPAVTKLTVKRHSGYRAKALHRNARATIKMTSADRFQVRGSMPASGTVRVVNTSDTLHFVTFQRVKPGTTDRQVQQSFASGGSSGPPPWAMQSPTMGADVLTPGKALKLTYRLHPGTYVLMCFVADDRSGMPHALMGMHKVVRFR
jgi:hypothetical protein